MNPFESGERKVIPAVLVFLEREVEGRSEFLMVERKAVGDFHQGKWNGLGGKCELDESAVEAALREVWEESGMTLERSDLIPLGSIHFPNFKPHKQEDWWVTVFRAKIRISSSDVITGPEGVLYWVEQGKILGLSLWPGDRLFLHYVFASQPFLGTIWYQDGNVVRSEVQRYG